MISKTLYVAGMKTESEFPDVYLDFIRQHGIPSALRRDNAKNETSQRVCQIHRDLVIADQWTEPHNPWQNPAELNGVKYLKSHAQVLLHRTGAPDTMWFLAQDYLGHIHNLPTTERPGHFVGFADNVGDKLTFKILKNDLSTVLHRPVVRSAADANH
jgi:hypothetical protein